MVEAVREFSLELFSFKISPLGFLWDVGRRVIQPGRKVPETKKVPRPLLSEQKRKSFNDVNNKSAIDNQREIKSKKHLAMKNTVIKILVPYITVSYEKCSVEGGVIP